MRKTLLFLMFLSVKLTFGQVSDDFSDGNFNVNPKWIGDTSQFAINYVKQLQTSLSTVGQSIMLVTPNFLAFNTKWEFDIQLNFDPSATNQAKIYLMADQANLNGSLNGYFIQIGENGNSDSYDLYKQVGTVMTKIIDGANKLRTDANKLMARLRVTRNEVGKWELYTSIDGGSNYFLEGTITDSTHAYSNWFGVSCRYTSTRSDGFIFDNFNITEVKPDVEAPILLSARVLNEHTVEVVFSERLQLLSALNANLYTVSRLGNPIAVTATSMPNVYQLNFAQILSSGDYTLTVHGIKDLKGNEFSSPQSVSFFYLQPYQLKAGDVLISEVLVNPKTGGVDFVEIYNNTDQVLDLKELALANADANGSATNTKNVSQTSIYMPAKTYWVLTSNSTVVKQHYDAKFPNQFIQMGMPAYDKDKGSVILLGSTGVLERLDYSENMHHALLKNLDGVALERVSFAKPATEAGNFASAAMSSGFATPSYRNSQEENPVTAKNTVVLANQTFSPDGDGFEDFLQINYHFGSHGNLVNVNIYNDKGTLVRKLQRNVTVATEGSFTWDGSSDNGNQNKVGIYIVKFEAFTVTGKVESFKQSCVLATKLN